MAESSGSLDALISVHYQEVRSLLWAITRNEATADELAQETFIVALKRGLVQHMTGDGVRHWLRGTARRLAMNEMRRKRPLSLDPDVLGAVSTGASKARVTADGSINSYSGGDSGTEESTTFDDELGALRQCMTELSETDRALLAERYERNTPIIEIAEKFKLSPDYVKLKLFRLRKALGERIKRKVSSHV